MSDRYVPAVIPADPERDARVAARRAADARRAGLALDRLLADRGPWVLGSAGRRVALDAYRDGWADGYAAADKHNSE